MEKVEATIDAVGKIAKFTKRKDVAGLDIGE